jgi:hypothetical protein
LYGLQRGEISIIAATFLPEAKCESIGTFTNGRSVQKRTLLLFKQLLDPEGAWSFNCKQQSLNRRLDILRMDEQVNMFGHVDKTNQEKALRNHRIVNALGQKTSTLIIIEQGQTVVTREGQFVNMAGQIVMVHLFTVAKRDQHE